MLKKKEARGKANRPQMKRRRRRTEQRRRERTVEADDDAVAPESAGKYGPLLSGKGRGKGEIVVAAMPTAPRKRRGDHDHHLLDHIHDHLPRVPESDCGPRK